MLIVSVSESKLSVLVCVSGSASENVFLNCSFHYCLYCSTLQS